MRLLSKYPMPMLAAALLAGCGADNNVGGEQAQSAANGGQSSPATQRGGTIMVGDTSWEIVPAIQCSVYPGEVVNIAGHAGNDPELEIAIDYNGPTAVRIGGEGGISWYAMKDTLKIKIDGKRVQGSATFNTDFSGAGTSAAGTFDVDCG